MQRIIYSTKADDRKLAFFGEILLHKRNTHNFDVSSGKILLYRSSNTLLCKTN